MEDIWFKDFTVIFDKNYLLNFFPSNEMTTKEQFNSILRFSIYFTLIMILFTNNFKYIYIIIFTALITYFMYIINKKQNDKKKLLLEKENLTLDKNKKLCTKPTKNNPFMNLTINEIVENPDKLSACDFTDNHINKSIKQNFNDGLYRSVDDIFEKNASDRQFYTTPNTQVVNDQTGLAEWLYKTPKTCKEDTINCYKNIYRYAMN